MLLLIFFFQAEDGIRDTSVTGVQTCALPILLTQGLISAGHDYAEGVVVYGVDPDTGRRAVTSFARHFKIGRASCRERVEVSVVVGDFKEKRRNLRRGES